MEWTKHERIFPGDETRSLRCEIDDDAAITIAEKSEIGLAVVYFRLPAEFKMTHDRDDLLRRARDRLQAVIDAIDSHFMAPVDFPADVDPVAAIERKRDVS